MRDGGNGGGQIERGVISHQWHCGQRYARVDALCADPTTMDFK
jgi:hypothetical protein